MAGWAIKKTVLIVETLTNEGSQIGALIFIGLFILFSISAFGGFVGQSGKSGFATTIAVNRRSFRLHEFIGFEPNC